MATLPQKCLILSERTNLEHEDLKPRETELPSSQKKKEKKEEDISLKNVYASTFLF